MAYYMDLAIQHLPDTNLTVVSNLRCSNLSLL